MSVFIAGTTLATSAISTGASIYTSRKDRQAADKASSRSLSFEKERYYDWQDVYGDLQSNLANYYETITPDRYAAIGLEAFNTEYQRNMQNLERTLIQRGIADDSGLALSLKQQAELGAAEEKAGIRRDAETAVRQEQANFLSLGMGNNPANSLSASLSNEATRRANRALESEQAAGSAVRELVPAITKAYDFYQRNKEPSVDGDYVDDGYLTP